MAEGLEGTDNLSPFEAAVAAAEAELVADTPSVEDAPSTRPNNADAAADDAVEDQGEAPGDNLSEDADDVEEFDFSFDENEEESSAPDPTPPATVFVPGIGEVDAEEAARGYLRQSDYTRKTQEIAELRRQLEEERERGPKGQRDLWQALQDSPKETVAWLAKQTGLLSDEELNVRLRSVEGVHIADDAAYNAAVQERLNDAVRNHPAVQQAIQQNVTQTINSMFDDISTRVGRPLSERAKSEVMGFAAENGIADLRVAFDALMARNQKRADSQSSLEKAAPTKRRSAPTESKLRQDGPVEDFDEAVERAYAELRASGEIQ